MNKNYFENRRKKFDVELKEEFIENVPKNALIELTNACNHACIFCYNPEMKRSISSIDINIFKTFVSKAASEGLEEVGLYSTGEPFMTKNLNEFIQIAKQSGLKRVYITSNGALASLNKVKVAVEAGLDSIKFSINAGSKETYKMIHGYDDFEKVIKNLKDIYNYKKKKSINLQLLCSFIYTNITKKEITTFKKKYQKYFDEEIRFIKAVNQGGHTKERSEILTSELVSDNEDKTKLISKNDFKPCGMLWDRLHLTAEGNLTACCVDYENDLVYKKFSEKEKIKDQFNSDKIVELRNKHLNNNLENTICYNCIYNQSAKYSKIDQNIEISEKKINKVNKKKIESLKNRIQNFKKISN